MSSMVPTRSCWTRFRTASPCAWRSSIYSSAGRAAVKLLIKGGRVVDPSRDFDRTADVYIEGGVIREVAPRLDRHESGDDTIVLDAAGLVVAPGLVDMHVHLREPGKEWAETIESGT